MKLYLDVLYWVAYRQLQLTGWYLIVSGSLEPLVFEFTELQGHGRRDYWLAIIREIVAAHNFARTYKLEGLGKSEALARAVLGICRLRAIRETFKSLPRHPHRLLTYSYGEEMPGGDMVMAELADVLRHSGHGEGGDTFLDHHEGNEIYASSATAAVASLGTDLTPQPTPDQQPEASAPVNKFMIGDKTPLEKTIMESRDNTKKVAMAQATIDAVQMEGIGTNVAVMTVRVPSHYTSWYFMPTISDCKLYFLSGLANEANALKCL